MILLQKSETIENGYVLTDTEAGVVIRFEKWKFNTTQRVTFLEDVVNPDALAVARTLRVMGEWLLKNHPEVVQATETVGEDMFFFAKNSGRVYLVREYADGRLFVSLDGEKSIPNAGLFIKSVGGVAALKSKCVRDSRPFKQILAELRAKEIEAEAKKKERIALREANARATAKQSEEEINLLLEQSGGTIEATEENIRLVARYLIGTNWGCWHLPPLSVGYTAMQYKGMVVTMIFDEPVNFDGGSYRRLVFGAKGNAFYRYHHCRL